MIGAIHPQKSRPIATYLLENAVVRNGVPDHRAEILCLEAGQVNEGKEVGGVLSVEDSHNQLRRRQRRTSSNVHD